MPSGWDKDPAAVLDYTVNWETWLEEDAISTATWTVPSGLTKDSDAKSTTIATVWLSGGTVGENYEVICHIVSVAGREDDRTIRINVRQR